MINKLINGTVVAEKIFQELTIEVNDFKTKYQKVPGLAVILVGNNPASLAYVGRKKQACAKIGIESFEYLLSENTSEAQLISLITELNKHEAIDGILLQLPLPKGLNEEKLLNLIDPAKDVDGFHPFNVGQLLIGLDTFRSCTPAGIMEMFKFYNIPIEGKHVVIVGRSNIVGKPLAAMLIQKGAGANATVTICHSKSNNLKEITRQADVLVAAIGQANFIKADFITEGTVVIDVGMNKIIDPTAPKGSRLVGDVDFANVEPKASFITPVPGGVGPMTIAMLMKNTVKSFKNKLN
jgi:methylenetetrahydrofolate dehydrogenase (NADP+)/methenyltetrahydrofolate cyclohydrolase